MNIGGSFVGQHFSERRVNNFVSHSNLFKLGINLKHSFMHMV
jgi:hypothetical protein